MLCSWLWLGQVWAATELVLPDWLAQVQQNKYKQPEAMLQLAQQLFLLLQTHGPSQWW